MFFMISFLQSVYILVDPGYPVVVSMYLCNTKKKNKNKSCVIVLIQNVI